MGRRTLQFEIEVDNADGIKSIQDLIDAVNRLNNSSERSSKGFRGLGRSIGDIARASGVIGIILGAVEILTDALRNNQAVVDALSTATNALGIAFNDFFNFIQSSIDPVTQFFQEIFDDPLGSLEQFAEFLVGIFINNIEVALDSLGLLGEAFFDLITGDFEGALDAASRAGDRFLDTQLITGTSLRETGEIIADVVEATIEYTTSTVAAGAAITEQTKQTEFLALQQQRLIEQFDIQAEQQRQLRDDVSRSINERIAANTRLGEILTQQAELEISTLQARIAAVRTLNERQGETQERLLEIFELETEIAAVQARITGQRSEQLTEENALLQEQREILQELRQIGLSNQELEIERINQEAENRRLRVEREVEDEEERTRILAAIEQDRTNQIQAIQDAAAAAELRRRRERDNFLLQSSSELISGISQIAEENSDLQKGLAVAAATIDTFQAANAAYLAGLSIGGPAGLVAGPLAAGAALAAGFANVQQILSVDPGGGGGASSSPQTPQQINLPTEAPEVGGPQSIDIPEQPNTIRAIVTTRDLEENQNLDRITNDNSRF